MRADMRLEAEEPVHGVSTPIAVGETYSARSPLIWQRSAMMARHVNSTAIRFTPRSIAART
jgi:hypothetical protein